MDRNLPIRVAAAGLFPQTLDGESFRSVGAAGIYGLGLLGAIGCGCPALCGVFAGDEYCAGGFWSSECGSGELGGVAVAQRSVLDSSVVRQAVPGLAFT